MSESPNLEGISLTSLLSVFTLEERQIIESMCKSGHAKDIPGRVKIFDPEREYKLEAIVALLAPSKIVIESEVKKELETAISQGFKIETPEHEAEWQEKLDKEKKKLEEKELKEKTRILRNLKAVKEAVSDLSEGEVKEEAPKRRGRPAKKELINEQSGDDTTVVDA